MNKYWNYKKPSRNAQLAATEYNRRHWRYANVVGPSFALRNSPEPFHTVTHREVGDIPGCTPAPREGIHRSEPLDVIQEKLHWRIARFLKANELSIQDKQSFFRGHSFMDKGKDELRGAYGEKL